MRQRTTRGAPLAVLPGLPGWSRAVSERPSTRTPASAPSSGAVVGREGICAISASPKIAGAERVCGCATAGANETADVARGGVAAAAAGGGSESGGAIGAGGSGYRSQMSCHIISTTAETSMRDGSGSGGGANRCRRRPSGDGAAASVSSTGS